MEFLLFFVYGAFLCLFFWILFFKSPFVATITKILTGEEKTIPDLIYILESKSKIFAQLLQCRFCALFWEAVFFAIVLVSFGLLPWYYLFICPVVYPVTLYLILKWMDN